MLLEIKKLSVRVKSSGLKTVDGIDLSVDAQRSGPVFPGELRRPDSGR